MYARPKGGRGGLFPLRTVLQSYSKGFLSIKALQKGKGVFGIVNPPAKQISLDFSPFLGYDLINSANTEGWNLGNVKRR